MKCQHHHIHVPMLLQCLTNIVQRVGFPTTAGKTEHQWRNVLSAVSSGVEMLVDKCDGHLDHPVHVHKILLIRNREISTFSEVLGERTMSRH